MFHLRLDVSLVHQGKIFLTHNNAPQIFDPVTKVWSTWAASLSTIPYTCCVSWRNSIIKFGGPSSTATVQAWSYNPATNDWTSLNTTPPFYLYNSGCTVLPNDNVLLTGCSICSDCLKASPSTMSLPTLGQE